MKKPKKPKVRKSKTGRNLVLYVQTGMSRAKIFNNEKSLISFVEEFYQKFPPEKDSRNNRIDVIIYDAKKVIAPLSIFVEVS